MGRTKRTIRELWGLYDLEKDGRKSVSIDLDALMLLRDDADALESLEARYRELVEGLEKIDEFGKSRVPGIRYDVLCKRVLGAIHALLEKARGE
jgi:hypothetical protein